ILLLFFDTFLSFFLLIRRPPISSLFPYTTLFRSSYAYLLKVSSPSKVSTYAYVNPFVAVLIGSMIGDEPFTSQIGFAAILMIARSEEHTSELQSRENLVCRLLLEKKKKNINSRIQ